MKNAVFPQIRETAALPLSYGGRQRCDGPVHPRCASSGNKSSRNAASDADAESQRRGCRFRYGRWTGGHTSIGHFVRYDDKSHTELALSGHLPRPRARSWRMLSAKLKLQKTKQLRKARLNQRKNNLGVTTKNYIIFLWKTFEFEAIRVERQILRKKRCVGSRRWRMFLHVTLTNELPAGHSCSAMRRVLQVRAIFRCLRRTATENTGSDFHDDRSRRDCTASLLRGNLDSTLFNRSRACRPT